MTNSRKGIKHARWTQADEERLIANIKNCPTNISRACMITSKEIGRTHKACMHHWYKYTSKGNHTLLLTMSSKHIARNRKNGKGDPTSVSLFKRVLAFLGLSY